MAEIAEKEQAVIKAAKAWAQDAEDGDSWAGPGRALLDAVRALESPKPPLPAEPPNLTVVQFASRHGSTCVLQRDDRAALNRGEGLRNWFSAGVAPGFTWSEVVRDMRPGTLVLLRPASEVVDADLAQRMHTELTELVAQWHQLKHQPVDPGQLCTMPLCGVLREISADMRAALPEEAGRG